MPSISYDGQSLSIDGRRIWLVSGSIHYTRTPHQLWRKRIRAAREAGLNCIDTYVFWNAHEPQPGQFNFEGDLNLRQFIQTIAEEGLFCILRPGPYICAEWDFGGLPPWLLVDNNIRLRQDDPLFLEACERYIREVMKQVRDLQVTTPIPGKTLKHPNMNLPGQPAGGFIKGCTGGGPIVLLQAENEWFCQHQEQAEKYLGMIVRFLKENGCEVPITNCNGLYQRVEGTIDAWNANWMLDSDLRQLATIQPDAPRFVSEFWPGWFDQWNHKHQAGIDDEEMIYRLAHIVAAGAQFNFYMFHGGTNFGFYGGRSIASDDCYITTSYEFDAPLLEAGGRACKYHAAKRLCTFISQFHHVFANLKPHHRQVCTALSSENHPTGVFHLEGNQGDVVLIVKSKSDHTRQIELLMPNGLRLPVDLADDRAAWILINTNLGGVAQLNYTNLRPWAFINRNTLILYGPANTQGVICIDNATCHCRVPAGKKPLTTQLGPFKLVVLNKKQVDAACLTDKGLIIGADGLDDQNEPLPHHGFSEITVLSPTGDIRKNKVKRPAKSHAPKLSDWQYHDTTRWISGEHEDFAAIDGPAGLEACDCRFGYAWYKIELNKSATGRVMAPRSGDRLHLYQDGKLRKILGRGPAANQLPVALTLDNTVVVLADNLGRYNVGQYLGETKGLIDHLYIVEPLKPGHHRIIDDTSPDPFLLSSFVFRKRKDDSRPAQSITWNIKPRKKLPVIVDIFDLPFDAVMLVNGKPVAILAHFERTGRHRFVLDPRTDSLSSGNNELKLALYNPIAGKVKPGNHLKCWQVTDIITDKCKWSNGMNLSCKIFLYQGLA